MESRAAMGATLRRRAPIAVSTAVLLAAAGVDDAVAAGLDSGGSSSSSSRPAWGPPPQGQTSAALLQIWTEQTVASFSLSQLDALTRISEGWCPLLSRAVHCDRRSGRLGARYQSPGGGAADAEAAAAVWVAAAAVYLEEEAELARKQAMGMIRHTWRNYEERAFGKDELKPVSGAGVDSWGGCGQTLVDFLDTLWVAGMREEFNKAADWVESELSFDKDLNVNFFETSIRHLGGLLSAYWFSRRKGILAKAQDLGDRLLKAYHRPDRTPAALASKREGESGAAADTESNSFAATVLLETLKTLGFSVDKIPSFPEAIKEAGGNVHAAATTVMESLGLSATMATSLAKILADGVEQAKENPSEAAAEAPPKDLALPYSDINLGTGEADNLAGYISLAETYMPVEWKALAMFTGNCSYATHQDEILSTINAGNDLDSQGFAAILLMNDGKPLNSPENRISLGGRGDSFYEYLLKDAVWTGKGSENATTQRLWTSFCSRMHQLFVEVNPASAVAAKKEYEEAVRKSTSEEGEQQALFNGRWRRHWRKRLKRSKAQQGGSSSHSNGAAKAQSVESDGFARGSAGALGGWYEDAQDAVLPWLFVKEVTFSSTVNKMDHLMCFFPGALALDVLREGGSVDALGGNISRMQEGHLKKLHIAHRLAQTCAHMYWRTVSDLAPEITRFNAHGLIDDLGSMHSILRPETIESLTLLWRTTRGQVYRNWGQRMLAAFARTRTRYGFASLNNVNQPGEQRDDMPSFFAAETLKYLLLIFSDDSVLPVPDMVLNTEAHPLPTLATATAAGLSGWSCDVHDGAPAEAQAAGEDEDASDALPSDSGPGGEPQASSQQMQPSPPPSPPPAASEPPLSQMPAAQPPQQQQPQPPAQVGDPACWTGGFVPEICCHPPPLGNLGCWDIEYNYARCCLPRDPR
eukprot:TRINITY_DN65859_c0_g2_i1.p1 TRINITY_DN65859_c0_g2~~TRINITY_DN65859_c0_g2_i1.p1  ORF type:complete len:924 (-),score=165.54 TRINITY_DN65859_c0_g2_i1:139-2910(-)